MFLGKVNIAPPFRLIIMRIKGIVYLHTSMGWFKKDFDRIDKSMFMAAVDCSKISEKNKIFEVKLLRQADFVNVTGIFPEKVEYIILK